MLECCISIRGPDVQVSSFNILDCLEVNELCSATLIDSNFICVSKANSVDPKVDQYRPVVISFLVWQIVNLTSRLFLKNAFNFT